jgi:hypothetical protein
MRIIETFLRRVFCFVVGIFGHRGALAFCLRMISAQTRSAFVARENRYPLFPILPYFSGVSSCMTPVK